MIWLNARLGVVAACEQRGCDGEVLAGQELVEDDDPRVLVLLGEPPKPPQLIDPVAEVGPTVTDVLATIQADLAALKTMLGIK